MFYEAALPLSGGQAPYQCALTAGDLPPGLFLDQQTCSLSGTPQAVGYVSQSFTFQVQVVDGSGSTAQATLSITIHPHPWITTISVPDAVMEMPYTTQLNSTGGTEPTSWVLVDGSLPAGLALDNGNGRISGTPAALKPAKTSLSTFTVRLSDGMGAVDFATFTMSVFPAMDEACDPGLTAPASLLSLGAAPAGAHLQLTWTAAGDASTYDVVGGRLSALRLTGGDFSVATDACVASDHSDTSVLVAGTPAIGDAFWFLVRSGNCQGDGSWDAGGDAQPVSRDESLAQSVNSCQ